MTNQGKLTKLLYNKYKLASLYDITYFDLAGMCTYTNANGRIHLKNSGCGYLQQIFSEKYKIIFIIRQSLSRNGKDVF
jgi:hypothetical protein